MFSACYISGLFSLTECSYTPPQEQLYTPNDQWTTSSTGDNLSYYVTSVTCLDRTYIKATVRVASNSPDIKHPDFTVAYIVGSLYFEEGITAYIDAIHVKIITNDLGTSIPPIPSFFDTHFTSLGTVCGEAVMLNDRSIIFPTTIDAFMLNDFKHFRIMCLYAADNSRWCTTPVPAPGSKVHISGTASRVIHSKLLAVELDGISFSFAGNRQPRSPSSIRSAYRVRLEKQKKKLASFSMSKK